MSGMGGSSTSAPIGSAGAPSGLFSNPLFNSAPQAQAMPQYVNQPNSEGPPKANPLDMMKGNKGLPSAPAQPFNPYQPVPQWARAQQGTFNDGASPNSPAPNMPTPKQLMTRFGNIPGGK